MRMITEDAKLVCAHELGKVVNQPTQTLVRIDGRRVLVENNPEGRDIQACPNFGLTIKPCQKTLRVQTGYSDFIRIDGKRICLDTVKGLTDGTPPGTIIYKVNDPGQTLVGGST
jgi:hypothetical protein